MRAQMQWGGSHDARVYFLSKAGRVKIGFTTNLASRMNALQATASEVHLLLVGGKPLETALHEYFAPFRVGRTEWFDRTAAIEKFINEKALTPALAPVRRIEAAPTVRIPDAAPDTARSWQTLLHAIKAIAPEPRNIHLRELANELYGSAHLPYGYLGWLRRDISGLGVEPRRSVRVGGEVAPGLRRADVAALTKL